MKVLQINSVCGHGSTGRIVVDLHDLLLEQGNVCSVAFGIGAAVNISEKDIFRFSSKTDYYWHNLMSRFTDRAGFYSKTETRKLISFIESYAPDLIHIHNIHGFYMNVEILFDFLKSYGKPVIWTIHDCWPFTGHCAHYSDNGCYRWKTECYGCPAKDRYPKSYFISNAKKNFRNKKRIFSGVPNLTITTPSDWLREQIEESFLNCYPVVTINNGVDLSQFHYTESDFRKKYQLEKRKILLGVSSAWIPQKGLSDFIKLAGMLDDTYRIVIVGLDNQRELPANILALPTVKNTRELVEIYSAADIYVSFSVEETFGLPTVEAMACGTPVLTYDKTALPEVVTPKCGIVVQAKNVNAAYDAIINFPVLNRADIIECAKNYDCNLKYEEFLKLYIQSINNAN